MTEKIKTWWSEDKKWFCMLVNDGVNQATVSLTSQEAAELATQAAAPLSDCDCGAANDTGRWRGIHSPGCAALAAVAG